jgi:hypothetical protein
LLRLFFENLKLRTEQRLTGLSVSGSGIRRQSLYFRFSAEKELTLGGIVNNLIIVGVVLIQKMTIFFWGTGLSSYHKE